MTPDELELELGRDGAEHHAGAAAASLEALRNVLAGLPTDRAGSRITSAPALARHLDRSSTVGALAAAAIGEAARPVRVILFDKTAARNWSLAWHQDRTITVKRKIDVPGYGPWTTKSGILHVAPPFSILAGMITFRIHLDDVRESNAPLLVAPGSHHAGRVSVDRIDAVVRACGIRACLAAAGDVWAYLTPILHASEAAREPARRRVLQVDYAATSLPGGLEWRGI